MGEDLMASPCIALQNRGHPLLWDATCPDTLAPSRIAQATLETGAATIVAESRIKLKYLDLTVSHHCVPSANETTGSSFPKAISFFYKLEISIRGITELFVTP